MTALSRPKKITLQSKLLRISWPMVFLVCAVAGVGFLLLYSAADGSTSPWVERQAMRFALGLVMMVFIAVIPLDFWYKISYPAYFLALALLVYVEQFGRVGMGAQRWIDLKFIQLQPSEIMKVALVMVLAHYFHKQRIKDISNPLYLLLPLVLVLIPALLVLKQPDLGTAMMLVFVAGAIFFVAGVRLWKFGLILAGVVASIPIAWNFLHDYQKNRVLTFLQPERDPLGDGYHIIQSKIALGSGGFAGKGFLQGTQSHLNFLPEKQTDFIFTVLAEEFGLIGGLGLLILFALILTYGLSIALNARSHFGRILGMAVTVNLFLYVFINIAMVMGLLPVVGVPLPLISYGGTVMLSVMASIGLILCVDLHKDAQISAI